MLSSRVTSLIEDVRLEPQLDAINQVLLLAQQAAKKQFHKEALREEAEGHAGYMAANMTIVENLLCDSSMTAHYIEENTYGRRFEVVRYKNGPSRRTRLP